MGIVKKSRGYSINQKKTLISTSAGFALENMDNMFLSFSLSSMIISLHISPATAGMTSSISNIGKFIGALLFGILADKFGRVKIFSYTIFVFAIATGALFFSHNIYEIYVLRFIAGIGSGGEFGAGVSLIAENFRGYKIGKLVSWATMGGQLGAIVAAIIASIVLPLYGWNTLFLFGLIPVILAFFIRRNLKESPAFEEEKAKRNDAIPHVSILELFQTPAIAWQTLGLMLMIIVEKAGYYGIMSWLPMIMQKQLHTSISKSSLWMVVTIVGICMGMLTFGYILDWLGPRLAFGLYMIIAAISIYGIAMSHNPLILLVTSALAGFFASGFYGGFGTVISRLYSTRIRSTANNTIMACGQLIGGFSPFLMGYLMVKYSLLEIMMMFSAMYIVSVIVMLFIPNIGKFNQKYAK